MSGSQDETGLGMDASSISGSGSASGSASTSPIIERSESMAPAIQPHRSVAAPTMRSAVFYLDQVPFQAGLANPSPLTQRPESMVHTHASINPQPMAGNLAPSGLTMAEGHRPQQYAYHQGQHGAIAGHQNQLSAELPMGTQGQRSYSQHPAAQPPIPGLTLIQRSAPTNNTSTSSRQSYPQGQPVWVRHPSQPHDQRQQRHGQRRHGQRRHGQRRHGHRRHGQQPHGQQSPTRPSIPGLTLIQDSAPANNTFTASDVPPSPSVPANSAGGVPPWRRFAVTPPWRRPH
ncbi:hypothetical protein N7536_001963 [Penicillium majusculum]|uniref:Uncharacterized protein n=1 Tax=Penicillium solitum TaxID=60172 RepID=A0A1V6QM80_9EURO|nr:uncharacterized protein PENSOL_c059G05476 [Penicillium solitum]KAJ5706274.1 hypothetical protein N7536_001963 [Penicillium majusculum]OQD90285.1 hypothetical protein PENSOL_c059G05476 [Penicillium solitum]